MYFESQIQRTKISFSTKWEVLALVSDWNINDDRRMNTRELRTLDYNISTHRKKQNSYRMIHNNNKKWWKISLLVQIFTSAICCNKIQSDYNKIMERTATWSTHLTNFRFFITQSDYNYYILRMLCFALLDRSLHRL